jgi:hypothetical protein
MKNKEEKMIWLMFGIVFTVLIVVAILMGVA